MRCDEVVELLPDYSVDLVQGRKRTAIDHHLADCTACAAEYRALIDTVSLVHSLPESEPVRPLWPGTRARIEAQAADAHRTVRGRVRRAALARPTRPRGASDAPGRRASDAPAWRPYGVRLFRPLAAAAAVAATAVLMWLGAPTPGLSPVTHASAEAPYVRAHLQLASYDPLSGGAVTEPLIILAGRAEGQHSP